jgi:hypothetical protein
LLAELTGLLASPYYQHLLNQPLLCYSTYCTSKCWTRKLLLSLMQLFIGDTGLFASDVLSTFDKPTIDWLFQLIMHHYQQRHWLTYQLLQIYLYAATTTNNNQPALSCDLFLTTRFKSCNGTSCTSNT